MKKFNKVATSLKSFIIDHLIEEEDSISSILRNNFSLQEDSAISLRIFMDGGPKFLSWLIDPM